MAFGLVMRPVFAPPTVSISKWTTTTSCDWLVLRGESRNGTGSIARLLWSERPLALASFICVTLGTLSRLSKTNEVLRPSWRYSAHAVCMVARYTLPSTWPG